MNLASAFFFVSGPAAAVIVIGGILAIIVGLIYWVVRSSKREHQANEAWAQEMGFQFERNAWPLGNTQGEQLELIRTAHAADSYRFENIFRGRYRTREITLFDVDYVCGQDQDGNDIHYTKSVAAFPLPGHDLPVFQIHPQHIFHKLKNKVVNSDISFEGPPEFSRQYFVRGTDTDAVRRFLSASFLNFLAGLNGTHYTIEGGNDWILIHCSKISAKGRREWLDRMMGVLEAMDSAVSASA